jgi:TRAP-type C4-dicarboxylate transport system substrate-binding protein
MNTLEIEREIKMEKKVTRTIMFTLTGAIFLLLLIQQLVHAQNNDVETIKLGTLATRGSSWGNILGKMGEELQAESKGKLKIKFYFGHDESDLLELLRNKQIDAASMTTVGLGLILREIYVLQIPFLFSNYEELDYVTKGITGDFAELFKQKDYIFLGWGETGFIYLFSKDSIRTQTDLKKTALWVRTDDPISKAFAISSGNEPVSLSIESVKPSLEKGDVRTVYNSPLGCIVLQWYPYVKYITDLRLVAGMGGTIIDKERFAKLPSTLQNLLEKTSQKYHAQLISTIRKDNEESLKILKNQGLQTLSVPLQEKRKWQQMAIRIQNQFIGEYYDQELLDKIMKLKTEFRSH